MRKKLRIAVQFLAHLAVRNEVYVLQRSIHRVVHNLACNFWRIMAMQYRLAVATARKHQGRKSFLARFQNGLTYLSIAMHVWYSHQINFRGDALESQ